MEINKETLESLLEEYNIGSLIKFTESKLGLMNKIYFFKTTKGEYVLKIVIQNNSGNRINYEIELLNNLKGLPVPKIIKRKDGNCVSKIRKNKVLLTTLLPGKYKTSITNKNLEEIGEFLGKMHNQTEGFNSKIKRLKSLDHSKNAINKIFKECRSIKEKEIIEALSYIENSIVKYLPIKNLTTGAIHSDLKPENCLFYKGKLSGVVDFDNSYNAPLIIDLANTIIWFCAGKDGLVQKKINHLVGGYKRSRRIMEIEEGYLNKAIHFAYLRNLLRGIEYYAKGKITNEIVIWAINNFLKFEKAYEN